ncbi:interleukin-9 receptor-like isoform X1 [Pelodiscus sinensis]|uniref:interleukin-9 receptor-like isoform X1 n=1 Tax=Pelodiscus sinensis TaxID=13735 RepID=UPI003F6D1B76
MEELAECAISFVNRKWWELTIKAQTHLPWESTSGARACHSALLPFSSLQEGKEEVDCVWEPEKSVGDGPFQVHFTSLVGDENSSCTLAARDQLQSQLHCTMNRTDQLTEYESFRVSLHGGFSGGDRAYVAFPEYKAKLNIKCDPPFNLQSNLSASLCRFQWSVPERLQKMLQFELSYKKHGASWEQAQHKQLLSSATEVDIEAIEFEAGINYTARIRCKTSQEKNTYKSQWSEWSQTTEFRREGFREPRPSFGTSMIHMMFIPVCLVVILYIILNARLSSRAKNFFGLKVPTPAAFFQPLYTLHNGNFKDWVGRNEAHGQLTRDEAANLSKTPVDGVLGLGAQDVISLLSFKTLAKSKVTPQEELCGPAPGPEQHEPRSRYVHVEDVAARLPSLFLQSHSDEAGARSETNCGSPDVSATHLPYLRGGEGDFLPQEALELESLSFCSNDYCTLCGSDSTGGPIPAELLQLPEEHGLVKE